ncbi:hypothetical protein PM082_010005 [Marasmius tenuissimus]|nr:hypothetical protein PM082_010005 [Marasmius tenuissimus]
MSKLTLNGPQMYGYNLSARPSVLLHNELVPAAKLNAGIVGKMYLYSLCRSDYRPGGGLCSDGKVLEDGLTRFTLAGGDRLWLPTTTDSAQHTGVGDRVFQLSNNQDRSEHVQEDSECEPSTSTASKAGAQSAGFLSALLSPLSSTLSSESDILTIGF